MSVYDESGARIRILMGAVYDSADGMRPSLDKIEGAWVECMAAWNDLKMSWVGKTKEEVDSFQVEIDQVQNMIFGSSTDGPAPGDAQTLDQPGLYQQVRGIGMGAPQNYYHADQNVAAMFTQTTANIDDKTYTIDGLGADGKPITVEPQPEPTGDAADMTSPPITETFG